MISLQMNKNLVFKPPSGKQNSCFPAQVDNQQILKKLRSNLKAIAVQNLKITQYW